MNLNTVPTITELVIRITEAFRDSRARAAGSQIRSQEDAILCRVANILWLRNGVCWVAHLDDSNDVLRKGCGEGSSGVEELCGGTTYHIAGNLCSLSYTLA